MFAVALNRLSKGEVFIDNQKSDNENIRDTIQKVEEMFLNKNEVDYNTLSGLIESLQGFIKIIMI